MIRTLLTSALALSLSLPLAAQSKGNSGFKRDIFNHLGVNVGVGLEGISIGAAAPVTNFIEVEGGVDIIPGMLSINGDLDVPSQDITVQGQTLTTPETTVDAKAKFSRTMLRLKANIYPFGGNTSFFIAAGCSFAGKKIVKLSGHSDELREFADQHPQYREAMIEQLGANLDAYDVKFDDDFSISGDIRCNSFRPYLGLGFGRLVPRHRVGIRFEVGCQFMGTMKVYQNDKELDTEQMLEDAEADDDISKFMRNWKWYPCLKLSIVGRIL